MPPKENKIESSEAYLKTEESNINNAKKRLDEAKDDYKKTEFEMKKELFEKHGYLVLSDLKYKKEDLIPGDRVKFETENKKSDYYMSPEKIKRLMDEKVISKGF